MKESKKRGCWRMQLHPGEAKIAAFHAAQSLLAGFIGLDFETNVGDLLRPGFKQQELPKKHRKYWAFAHEMDIDDRVLVSVHHFPFALVTVAGEYNYIREPVPQIGVWFRHFRRIEDVRFYADELTNIKKWEPISMTDAIEPLRNPQSQSFRLIQEWLGNPNRGAQKLR